MELTSGPRSVPTRIPKVLKDRRVRRKQLARDMQMFLCNMAVERRRLEQQYWEEKVKAVKEGAQSKRSEEEEGAR
jgi:hypothetical protein